MAVSPQHVVMVVCNDVSGDSRVQKSAASAAAAGYRVTVVGYAPDRKRSETGVDGYTIVRVPVPFNFKKRAQQQGTAAAAGPAYDSRSLSEPSWQRRNRRRHLAISVARERVDALDRGWRHRPTRLMHWARILFLQRVVRLERSLYRGMRRLSRYRDSSNRARLMRKYRRLNWRDEFPVLVDFELAYAPVVAKLEPDLIHAHDHQTISLAARVKTLLRAEGRDVKFLYDAHEYVGGLPTPTEERLAALLKLEGDHIGEADAITTVSPVLSGRLAKDYDLERRPALVLNAPIAARFDPQSELSVRTAAGVGTDVPLIVYSGGVKPERGLETLVNALPTLEQFHAAVVAKSEQHPHVRALMKLAEELEVRDRLHIVPYVPQDQVINYLRTADVAAHTLLPSGNAKVALPNKLFEYIHALVPVVLSDLPAMHRFVDETDIGEVFIPGDSASFAAVCRRVYDNRAEHRTKMADPELRERCSWEHQSKKLVATYRNLLGPPRKGPRSPEGQKLLAAPAGLRYSTRQDVSLGIGPWDSGGQAGAVTEALRAQASETAVEAFAVSANGRDRAVDRPISIDDWHSMDWQFEWIRRLVGTHSHLLVESGSSVCGTLNGNWFDADLPLLQRHGIQVALLLNDGDIRDPRRMRELEAHSSDWQESRPAVRESQQRVDELRKRLDRFDGTVFVSSPELLDHLPAATWLPIPVLKPEPHPTRAAFEGGEPPVVLHPVRPDSQADAKAAYHCRMLADAGLIQYTPVSHWVFFRDAHQWERADIVVGDLACGGYDLPSLHGLRTGRLVLGHVRGSVRERTRVPIFEASAEGLGAVLRQIDHDPLPWMVRASSGPAFAREFYDGRYTVAALAPFLGLDSEAGNLPEVVPYSDKIVAMV